MAHKYLIRDITASICGFDCKSGYKLSVCAIYLENQKPYKTLHHFNLLNLDFNIQNKNINKSYRLLFSLECPMYRT